MDRLARVANAVADSEEAPHVHPPHVDQTAGFVIGGLIREL
jgi:hypothetical protein